MFRIHGFVSAGWFLFSFLYLAAATNVNAKDSDELDYEHLPRATIFPGPWEENIRAPVNKSHITPVKIFNFEGATRGFDSVLLDATTKRGSGLSWVIGPGGLVTFEFGENIAGKYVFALLRIGFWVVDCANVLVGW